MTKAYNVSACKLCGKVISCNGLASHSHAKYHERLGDIVLKKSRHHFKGRTYEYWDFEYTEQGWEKVQLERDRRNLVRQERAKSIENLSD